MDMREIQRLHAQFAPDSMVIDLPRQIAALPSLPAPGDFSANTTLTTRARWLKAGPLARRVIIALAVAGVTGMAGMGAASVYTTWRAAHPAPALAASQKPGKAEVPVTHATLTPSYQDINAAPARPVPAALALSARDFANPASLGLTAEQFRDSLKAPARTGVTNVAPALNTEAERAAASPIHQAGPDRQQAIVKAQPMPAPLVSTVAGVAANSSAEVSAPKTEPTPSVSARLATNEKAATAPVAETDKPARPVRRHISRPLVETPSEPEASSKPAAAPHSGAAEVQMF